MTPQDLISRYGNVGAITGTSWSDPYDGRDMGMFYDAANAPNKGVPGMAFGYTPVDGGLYKGFMQSDGNGAWMGNYNETGQLQGDPYWEENKENWLSKLGPMAPFVLAAGAYGASSLFGGTAGAGATAGGAAAPISASTPSWVAGMPTATGAGLEAGLAGVGSTWAGGTGGAAAAGTGGIGSFLSGLGNKITQNPLGYLSAGLNAYSQYRQGDYQQDSVDQQMQNRQGFIDRLNATYTNPEAVLQGPEYQSLLNVVSSKLQRSDAARGRLANDAERQKLMMDHAAAYLDNYRRGLTSAMSGSPIGSDMIRAGTAGAADQMGLFNALLSMAGRDMTPKPAYNFSPQSGYVFNLGDV